MVCGVAVAVVNGKGGDDNGVQRRCCRAHVCCETKVRS